MTKAFDEIVGFIAAGSSREAVIRFRASDETKARVEELVRKEKGEGLLPEEVSELDDYLRLEHLMRMAKARALSLDRDEQNLD
jgi:predicted house-cleaning noncanonical NTP pyrophosphatase (MazG superfamily)